MSVSDCQLVEQAIRYLERNAGMQPELREVAASAGLSEFYFQRLFQRWAGVSPKRFLQFQTAHSDCALDFLEPDSEGDALERLRAAWENTRIAHAPQSTGSS